MSRLMVDAYFRETRVAVSGEIDTGTGKIDFTFTHSIENVLIEIKLGSNAKLRHALEDQLVHYMNARKCLYGYCVVVCFTEKELFKANQLIAKAQKSKNGKVVELIILDATQKVPASKL